MQRINLSSLVCCFILQSALEKPGTVNPGTVNPAPETAGQTDIEMYEKKGEKAQSLEGSACACENTGACKKVFVCHGAEIGLARQDKLMAMKHMYESKPGAKPAPSEPGEGGKLQ